MKGRLYFVLVTEHSKTIEILPKSVVVKFNMFLEDCVVTTCWSRGNVAVRSF